MIGNFDMKLTKKYTRKYRKASKKEKGEILKNYCNLTFVNRNTAVKRLSRIRLIAGQVINKKNNKGAKKKYISLHYSILKKCWELADHICAERLQPILPECINQLEKNNKLKKYQKYDKELVANMSEITVKRAITKFLTGDPRYKLCRKKPSNLSLFKQIPIKANFGKYAKIGAGYIEIDYVEQFRWKICYNRLLC